MPVPILATKIYIPPPRTSVVPRLRLVERLNECLEMGCKLTLISAPAGFGKTTLVSEWIAKSGMPAAWLSLDGRDNDPARFISYLVKALQTIQAGIGEGLLAALQSPEPLQIETILTTLLNEISTVQKNFLLVLDDYHSIDSPLVDQALVFLIEHQPLQMYLLIATREDPDLPLARLRARGQCTELRAADLRFTPAEAAEFLNRMLDLKLSDEDVAALEARTEGWIAGLQLAAISMRGIKDTSDFIQSFTGSHRFVMDYLLEEVLHQQPENIQAFLLSTSILDRMCGPLIDAVLLDPSVPGQETLEHLERANLFVVPQDNERRWYRYHQLFGDLLRNRMGQSLTPAAISDLHLRASQWYESNDLILEAFSHAVAANDIERAIRLMDSRKMPLHLRGVATAILGWLESLPKTLLDARPALWWKRAAMYLIIGQPIRVEENLQAAESALDAAALPGAELDEITRDLIGKIAVSRANLAQIQIQVETIFVQARRALEYLHPDNLADRSSATCALGYSHFWQGEWAEADRAYTQALSLAQTAGDVPNSILALIRLGQLSKDQNRLHLAAETYQRALRLFGDCPNPYAIVAYLGLTETFYKWNNIDAAEQYAEQGLKLAQQYDQVYDRIIMSELHLALIKLARGDIPEALQLVSQAEQISYQKSYTPRQSNIAFFKAWIYLRQGDLDAAAALAGQNDIPLMQARILIARNKPVDALAILGPLRQEAEVYGWAGRLLEVMAEQSIAFFENGEKEKAAELFSEVLARAEPESCVRLFVDEGEPMRKLISYFRFSILKNSPHLSAYLENLLAAFPSTTIQFPNSTTPNLVEPLTQRELKIIQLIAQGLSNREIGERLFLALDTIKGHNRKIFDKLQVQSRTEAVACARELGLL